MQYQQITNSPAPVERLQGDVGNGREGALELSLSKFIAAIRKRKWLLIGSVLGALLLGLIVTLLTTPQYTSKSVVEIQRETRNFTNVEGADARSAGAVDPEFYDTQAGLLQAISLSDAVATDNKLEDSQHFFAMFGSPLAKRWFADGNPIANASSRDQRIREASKMLLAHLKVSIVRQSRLATISFSSPEPAFSKKIVDEWVSHYIQGTLDRRYAASSYARKFLETRLGQLRTRIDQAEHQLVDYAGREGIVNLPSEASSSTGVGGVPERSLVAEDLIALDKERTNATAQRIGAESRLGSGAGDVEEALSNGALTSMRSRRADLAAQYASMLQKFDTSYPPALALKAQISATDQSIGREESRVRSTLQETYDSARHREVALSAQVDRLKSELLDTRRRSTQYNILLREVDTNRQLYDALLQRYKEIGVSGGVGVNNISVVDAGDLPNRPSSPRLWLNLAFALIGGLLVGTSLTFALEQLEDSVTDPAAVPELLRIPLIGVIPRVSDDPVLSLLDVKSALSEAYFSAQTSLALSTPNGFPKTLVVTSSRASEGKSLTSLGLSKTLASQGGRVLLIDSDMRSPSIHRLVHRKVGPGLSNILAGMAAPRDVLQETDIPNLVVVGAGPIPPSPAELLSVGRLTTVLASFGEIFDHIIIDAPPVMGFADAPLIANQVNGICFVIEAHATNKSSARTAIARLRDTGGIILGAVVTKFDAKRSFSAYGYDYGYGYSYGEAASGARKQ